MSYALYRCNYDGSRPKKQRLRTFDRALPDVARELHAEVCSGILVLLRGVEWSARFTYLAASIGGGGSMYFYYLEEERCVDVRKAR